MRKIEINSENNYKIDDDLILFKFSNIDPQTKSIFFGLDSIIACPSWPVLPVNKTFI